MGKINNIVSVKTAIDRNLIEELENALKSLQDEITQISLQEKESQRISNSGLIEFLIQKDNQIAIRMDANKNHQRPHIHLDYGSEHHSASYAIDNGERLAGTINNKSHKAIKRWIYNNRDTLMKVWEITRTSPQPDDLVARLKATKFWL